MDMIRLIVDKCGNKDINYAACNGHLNVVEATSGEHPEIIKYLATKGGRYDHAISAAHIKNLVGASKYLRKLSKEK